MPLPSMRPTGVIACAGRLHTTAQSRGVKHLRCLTSRLPRFHMLKKLNQVFQRVIEPLSGFKCQTSGKLPDIGV